MTVSASLIRVGNSRAVIIPAKILKSLDITENTILELSTTDDGIRISRTEQKRKDLVLPKVIISEPDEAEINAFMSSLSIISADEISNDQRLDYILNR